MMIQQARKLYIQVKWSEQLPPFYPNSAVMRNMISAAQLGIKPTSGKSATVFQFQDGV